MEQRFEVCILATDWGSKLVLLSFTRMRSPPPSPDSAYFPVLRICQDEERALQNICKYQLHDAQDLESKSNNQWSKALFNSSDIPWIYLCHASCTFRFLRNICAFQKEITSKDFIIWCMSLYFTTVLTNHIFYLVCLTQYFHTRKTFLNTMGQWAWLLVVLTVSVFYCRNAGNAFTQYAPQYVQSGCILLDSTLLSTLLFPHFISCFSSFICVTLKSASELKMSYVSLQLHSTLKIPSWLLMQTPISSVQTRSFLIHGLQCGWVNRKKILEFSSQDTTTSLFTKPCGNNCWEQVLGAALPISKASMAIPIYVGWILRP